ncbi:MAG: hypothetical protein QXJ75_05305 [Candidatus Bathyarchaeia archaeon]
MSIASGTVYGSAGVRYVFEGWNDGYVASSRSLKVTSDFTYVAIYKTQYFLTVLSPYGNPRGQGWYDKDSLANFAVDPVYYVVEGKVRYVFNRWNVGLSPWTSENSIYMSGPTTVMADWVKQYWLEISSAVKGIPTSGSGWYDRGFKATISTLDELEVEKNRRKYVFDKWVNVGENLAYIRSPTDPVTTLDIDNFYSIKAEFVENWYIDVASAFGDPQGGGYYPANSRQVVSVTNPWNVVEGESRYVFTGWTGSLNSTESSLEVLVDGPKTLQAEWKKQYYLKINSAYGGVTGSGWYDKDSNAFFSASPSISGGWGIKYIFTHWSGDYAGTSPSGQIFMSRPRVITAEWAVDYTGLYLNIAVISGIFLAVAILVKKFVLKKVYLAEGEVGEKDDGGKVRDAA